MTVNKAEVLLTSEKSGQLWNLGIFDPETGTLLTSFKGNSTLSHTVSLVGNDYILSAQPDKPLLNVWQTNRNEQASLRMFAPGKCTALAASPRGNYIIAAVDEKISIWQTSTGRLWNVLSAHYQPVTCLQFTNDGSHFVSAGADGQVLCWSLCTVISRRNLPGLQMAQVGKPDPRWSWRDHALPVTDLTISHGGVQSKIVTVSKDQTCKVFCLVSGQLLLSVAFPVALSCVAMDAACDSIYVGGDNGHIYTFSLRSPPRSVSVSAEAVSASNFSAHKGCVTHLSLSLDGLHLASGGEDAAVKIWHIRSGQCVRTIEMKGAVTSLRYMIPPPAMFSTELWQPSRKLVPLQKGAEDREPFVTSLISKEEKPLRRYEDKPAKQNDNAVQQTNSSEDTGRIQELTDINQQLYQFAVKNILKT